MEEQLQRAKPIDFFFNDGHHDRDAVIEYFEQSKPYLANDAVIVFDDIDWSEGMSEAWKEIQRDDVTMVSIDLGGIGVVVLGQGERNNYRLPL